MNNLKEETLGILYRGVILWIASRCHEIIGPSIAYSMSLPHMVSIEITYRLLDRYPDNADLHFHMYSLLFYNAEEPALRHMELAIEKDRDKYGFLFFSAGNHFYNKGNYRESIKYLWKAIDYNPKDKEAYSLLGEIYMKENKVNTAVMFMRKALKVFPGEPIFLLIMGSCFLNNANFKKAIECFTEISRGNSELREVALFKLGIAFMITGRRDDAIEAWERLLSCNPHKPRGYYCLGIIHKDIDMDKSKKYLSNCLEKLSPEKKSLMADRLRLHGMNINEN